MSEYGHDISSSSHGAVPRSIDAPVTTNANNITGKLNIFMVAKNTGIKRVVFAASSSTYGDSKQLPKVEDNIGVPLSSYAVTKLVSELYAKVFSNLYGIDFIGLRYFIIFGSKQDSNGAYAAVIPLFYKVALKGKPCYINGDGSFSRDYTYVDNAAQANTWGFFLERNDALNRVYNVACGGRTTLLELWDSICLLVGKKIEPIHRGNRAGDIPHSLADVSKIVSLLDYKPQVKIQDGIKRNFTYYKNLFETSK